MIKLKLDTKQLKKLNKVLEHELRKIIPEHLSSATVGLHEDTGLHQERNIPFLIPVAQVGVYGHFGTKTQPARPWLDVGFMNSFEPIKDVFKQAAKNDTNLNQALEKSMRLAKKHIKKYVIQLRVPANSPDTILRKGFDNPLIHTRQMLHSIDYKIYNRGKYHDV